MGVSVESILTSHLIMTLHERKKQFGSLSRLQRAMSAALCKAASTAEFSLPDTEVGSFFTAVSNEEPTCYQVSTFFTVYD